MPGLVSRNFKSVGDQFVGLFYDTGSGYAPYDAGVGAPTDTVAPDDTSTASLVSLVRRGLARWTTFLGRIPSALGRLAAANSFGVTLSNEDLSAINYTGPSLDGFSVSSLSDTINFTNNARALYVGGAGDVSLMTPAGTTLIFRNVAAGTTLPIATRRVNAANTTATAMIGLL